MTELLTRIWARNLACFGDDNYGIDLAPETVIVGPNNVGKSVLIAGFNFLRNIQYRGWQWDTESYSWENPTTITHRKDPQLSVQLGATIEGKAWSGKLTARFGGAQGNFYQAEPRERTDELHKEFSNIWFLRASRSDIPRQMQVGSRGVSAPWQPLEPDGSNVVTYLLERYTSRDPRWNIAEDWLKRIVPEFSVLKSPLRGAQGSIETQHAGLGVDINVAYQGTGTQKVLSTIAAVVFSPEGGTIIVEEPEIHLHPRSQEVLVDLFNLAVNEWGKQVVFTTHSWDMLLPFISDLGTGPRGKSLHHLANPNKVRLVTFALAGEKVEIKDYDLKDKIFANVKEDFKKLWG